MSLREYNKKRNFNSTVEPLGKINKSKAGRFVIQFHRARKDHYDFRLEFNGVLLSWAVPKGLSDNLKDKRLAVKVEDHPVDYIEFEGVIPKGNYGAGTVEIYDEGKYLPIKDMNKGLKTGHIKVVLDGKKVRGAYSLIKIEENNWLIVKIDDGYAELLENKQIKNQKLPFEKCSVMLATLTDEVPKGKEFISEIKYDGYRIISFVEKKKVKLYSRNYIDYTERFKIISNDLKKIENTSFILDGEVVCFDNEGRSDFGLLQSSIKKKQNDFYYVVFDILSLDGEDLRELSLIKRKQKLERLIYGVSDRIIYSAHVDNVKECLKFSKEKNLEGIVVKRKNSQYVGGRSKDWLKIKNGRRQEFVIAGYSTSQKNDLFSALLVGYYDNKKLIYVGKVGTGFSDDDKKHLFEKFKKLQIKTCPFSGKVKENAVWLSPKLVAEIKFSEFTKEGALRQSSFIGLREDKKAKEVVYEEIGKSD